MNPWGVLYFFRPNRAYYVFCSECWKDNYRSMRDPDSKKWDIFSDQLHGLRVRCYFNENHAVNPGSALALCSRWDTRSGLAMGYVSDHTPGDLSAMLAAITAGDKE